MSECVSESVSCLRVCCCLFAQSEREIGWGKRGREYAQKDGLCKTRWTIFYMLNV